MESSNSNSKEKELQLTQRLIKQRHSHCMTWFEQLETYLRDLYLNSSSHAVDAFKAAFRTFFGEEHQTFRLKMFYNLDQLRLQLEKENLHEVKAKTCLEVLRTHFKEFFAPKGVNSSDHLNQCWQQDFEEYTLCDPKTYRRDLLETLDTLDAVIHRADPVNDQVPFPEVDSNTTPDSTNMSHRGREIDQDAEQDQVKNPLLNTEFLKTNDMVEKEVYNDLSKQIFTTVKNLFSLEFQWKHNGRKFSKIAIGQRFSLNKSSAVHEKPNTPRSCLKWIPTGRIFKLAGLRWIPTGKLFDSCTSKVDSGPPNGSNDAITNPYECNQTLNVSAGTLNLNA
ncbi:hypothetical protein Tco_1504954 [Tanacetum coccineum]